MKYIGILTSDEHDVSVTAEEQFPENENNSASAIADARWVDNTTAVEARVDRARVRPRVMD